MEEENKNPKIESIGSSISSILLTAIEAHQTHMTIADLGGENLEQQEKSSRNSRNGRKVRSLPRIISSQQSMIRISLGFIKIQSINDWKKAHPTEADREINQFDSYDSDYKELLRVSKILRSFLKSIRDAEWTDKPGDDFIRQIQHQRANYEAHDWILTENFFDMLCALEDSFGVINDIMLGAGLITDTITEVKSRSKSSGIY